MLSVKIGLTATHALVFFQTLIISVSFLSDWQAMFKLLPINLH